MSLFSSIRNSSAVIAIRKIIPDDMVNMGKHLPMAVLANIVYGFPSKKLKLLGVTGTNGKTTTATMLYDILHQSGYKVALISTVSAKIGDENIDTGFHVTSPDHFALQKLFKTIADKEYEYVVLETTSHGFAQHRLWGLEFKIGILTNVTEDHLLYHKTMQKYAEAKSMLFQRSQISILNVDDEYFDFMIDQIKKSQHTSFSSRQPRIRVRDKLRAPTSGIQKIGECKVITYGKDKGDFNLKKDSINLKLIGEFNQLNGLAAVAAACQLGVDEQKAIKFLSKFAGISGRMQVMQKKPFTVIVDFAHTPDALEKALTELRRDAINRVSTKGRIISVFGCAGLRDVNRRKMGKVSAKLADITIITAEDPRREGVEKISDEIAEWAEKGKAKQVYSSQFSVNSKFEQPIYMRIPDRQEAIDFAIQITKPGDVVGIFGKGHEQSMCFGTEEKPWTDQEAAKRALKKMIDD